MAGVEENRRQRIAMLLVVAGILLILVGIGFSLRYQDEIETLQRPVTSSPSERISQAKAIQRMLFLLLVIVGIFSVGTFAFLRWSRKFRAWILRKPHSATPDSDVWSMYRLPEDQGPDNAGNGDAENEKPPE